jgi:hypothetical protein
MVELFSEGWPNRDFANPMTSDRMHRDHVTRLDVRLDFPGAKRLMPPRAIESMRERIPSTAPLGIGLPLIEFAEGKKGAQ